MTTIKRTILPLAATAVLISAYANAFGVEQQQLNAQPRPPVEDPIRDLNLSPEQRERIRAIREQQRDERAAINQRLKEASDALEEALDVDNPDEAVIEQRMRDVAAAQVASMRMRVLNEVKIRRVLTLEQLVTLRLWRKRTREERRIDNLDRRREAIERQRGITTPRNSLGPLFQPVDPQRKRRP